MSSGAWQLKGVTSRTQLKPSLTELPISAESEKAEGTNLLSRLLQAEAGGHDKHCTRAQVQGLAVLAKSDVLVQDCFSVLLTHYDTTLRQKTSVQGMLQ